MRSLAFLLLLPALASAGPLDKAVDRVNKELEPKGENQLGWEVDYRSEASGGHTETWINVTLVKRTCQPTVTNYLKGGKIVSVPDADSCFDHWDMSAKDGSRVIQIMCYKTRDQACVNSLARELTPDVIKLMISKGFDRVYVQ